MWNRIIRRVAICSTLWTGVALVQMAPVEAAEPEMKIPVQTVGLFHRSGGRGQGTNPSNDARVICEQENWRTKHWDESCWVGRLHTMTQQHSRNKEAWHLYIRGVGPAIHERPPGSPCFW